MQTQQSAPPGASRVEELFRLALEAADLLEHLVDLLALALEVFAARGERSGEFLELRPLVGRGVVEPEHLAHLGKGETQSFAAQNELQAHGVALGINPATAVAPGREQTLVLVETDRSRSDVELAGEVSYGTMVVDRLGGVGRHNLRKFTRRRPILPPAKAARSIRDSRIHP